MRLTRRGHAPTLLRSRPWLRGSSMASGCLLTLSLAGLLVIGPASAAAAHVGLVSSYPAAGGTIPAAPTELSLTLSDVPQKIEGSVVIEVVGADGRNIATGQPQIVGASITQHLLEEPVVGAYTVRWRVVSGDGHSINDEYRYTVEAIALPSSDPPPTRTPASGGTPKEQSLSEADAPDADVHSGPSTAIPPALVVVGGVALIGSAAIVVFMAGRERHRRDRIAAARRHQDGEAQHDDT